MTIFKTLKGMHSTQHKITRKEAIESLESFGYWKQGSADRAIAQAKAENIPVELWTPFADFTFINCKSENNMTTKQRNKRTYEARKKRRNVWYSIAFGKYGKMIVQHLREQNKINEKG